MADTDVSTLRICGRYQGQNIVNTVHYQHTDQAGSDEEILRDLAIGWSTQFKTGWLARHNDAYTLVGLKAFVKEGTSKTPGYLVIDEAGAVVADQAVSFLCRTMTLYTADENHRRRGRIMISASNAAMFDASDGAVTTSELGLMQVLADLLEDPITYLTNTWTLVLPKVLTLGPFPVTDIRARVTPSSVTSRRVRQFAIG